MPANVPTQDEFESELTAIAQAVAAGKAELHDRIDSVREGLVVAIDKALKDSGSALMDLLEAMERIEKLEAKVFPAPEPEPEPPNPEPEPQPQPTTRLSVSNFKLVGGFRLKEPFSGGGLAIDFDSGIVYQGGHDQTDAIMSHRLPEIGLGEPDAKHSNWPVAETIGPIQDFWRAQPWGDFQNLPDHNNGLCFSDGKLWVSPRVKYDATGKNRLIKLCASDGERINVPLDRAGFGGGFIEGHPEFLIGCGSYRSGQGSKAGPTVARISGEVLLDAAPFNTPDPMKRTPRASGVWPVTNKDEWYCTIPRKDDGSLCTKEESLAGVGTGRWGAETILDGGVWHSRGLMFWPMMALGVLDYAWQSEQFAANGASRPFAYFYDPVTFELQGYEQWPYGQVHGCEVGPDGRIYLMRRNAWKSGYYQVDSAVYVFEVQ